MIWPAFGLLLGAIVGSYLATIVVRWPMGETTAGRSRCDGCGRPLRVHELVPLLSWMAARGACRVCSAAIDGRHPAIELAAAAIGATALAVQPGMAGVAGAILGWLLLTLAILDLQHFWLPDRLTGTLAITGLATGLAGLQPALADRLIGGVAGFALLAAIALAYRRWRGREGLGAGDAKLLGAIGLWLGWRALPIVLLAASVVGIAGAIGLRACGRPVSATTRLPLGTLMAVAGWGLWLADAIGLLRIE